MYKVLIVEDDINFRYAITETIPWENNGFEVIGSAIHGKQALEILKKQEVNIILTDMSMPQMNGVELTKVVTEKYPSIKVFALSAYDDFQFVKESLKYGAKDYFLKQSMDADKMITTIKKVFREEEARNEKKEERDLREQELRLHLRENRALKEETKQFIQSIIPREAFFIMLISVEKRGLATMLKRFRSDKRIPYVIADHESKILVVWSLKGLVSSTEIRNKMHILAREVLGNSGGCSVYISKESGSGFGLAELIGQANLLMTLKRYYDNKLFIYYDYESLLNKRKTDYLYDVKLSIVIESEESIRNEIDKLSSALKLNIPDIEHMNKNFLSLCDCFMKKIELGDWKQVIFYEQIQACSTLKEKAEYTAATMITAWKKSRQYRGESKEIQKAVQYIYEHYQEEISLATVAEKVGLSENYFSNFFKAEMNENLTHYINRIRIEQAKRLMDTTNMKVYEIAKAVGYHNTTYFSTIFKKITNMAISDYKKKDNN